MTQIGTIPTDLTMTVQMAKMKKDIFRTTATVTVRLTASSTATLIGILGLLPVPATITEEDTRPDRTNIRQRIFNQF